MARRGLQHAQNRSAQRLGGSLGGRALLAGYTVCSVGSGARHEEKPFFNSRAAVLLLHTCSKTIFSN